MSEIVGVLLMVAVVVGLGVLVFFFANSGMSGLSQGYSAATTGKVNAEAEKFKIEQAAFTLGTSGGADLYVRNVGTIPTTLVSVYVTDTTTDTYVTQVTISTTINVGAFAEIPHATLAFTPVAYNTYSFTVASSLGNSATYTEEAV